MQGLRSEERRVGKECNEERVDLGGRRIIQAEDGIRDNRHCDWSSDVCSSDLSVLFLIYMLLTFFKLLINKEFYTIK